MRRVSSQLIYHHRWSSELLQVGLFGNIFNVFILSKMCLTLTWIQHINSKHTFYEKTKHLIYAILPMIQLCEPANLFVHMHNSKLGC